jgi:hypothetical protein
MIQYNLMFLTVHHNLDLFHLPTLTHSSFIHTVQPFTDRDDTRCCDNTICPPEDGHMMLETCRGL